MLESSLDNREEENPPDSGVPSDNTLALFSAGVPQAPAKRRSKQVK